MVFGKVERLGLVEWLDSILSEVRSNVSTISFLSREDAEVALDLTVDDEDERLVFIFRGRIWGELVVLPKGSSSAALMVAKL